MIYIYHEKNPSIHVRYIPWESAPMGFLFQNPIIFEGPSCGSFFWGVHKWKIPQGSNPQPQESTVFAHPFGPKIWVQVVKLGEDLPQINTLL